MASNRDGKLIAELLIEKPTEGCEGDVGSNTDLFELGEIKRVRAFLHKVDRRRSKEYSGSIRVLFTMAIPEWLQGHVSKVEYALRDVVRGVAENWPKDWNTWYGTHAHVYHSRGYQAPPECYFSITFGRRYAKPSHVPAHLSHMAADLPDFGNFEDLLSACAAMIREALAQARTEAAAETCRRKAVMDANGILNQASDRVIKTAKAVCRYDQRLAALRAELKAELKAQTEKLLDDGFTFAEGFEPAPEAVEAVKRTLLKAAQERSADVAGIPLMGFPSGLTEDEIFETTH